MIDIYIYHNPQYINMVNSDMLPTDTTILWEALGKATVHLPGEILVGHGTQAIDCCQDLYFVEDLGKSISEGIFNGSYGILVDLMVIFQFLLVHMPHSL